MDFDVTPEQEALIASMKKFGQTLNGGLVERDREGTFASEAFRRCGEIGLVGLPIPEEHGGSGADPLTTALALEAFSYACRDEGLTFSICAHQQSCAVPIWLRGSEEQKRKWLPGLCSGALLGGNGMSEPDSGSDAFSMRTTAVRDGEGYRLNGRKTFVTNGPNSDVLILYAVTNREYRQFGGISAFLVERGTPGLTLTTEIDKMGLRTSKWGEVTLDDCFVPLENRLGQEGSAVDAFNVSMEWERLLLYAATLGRMQDVFERCLKYAKTRKQFGQNIGKFQDISHKIVDMQVDLEAARLLLYKAAWLKTQNRPAQTAIALAKLHASECRVRANLAAIQIHGGYGYATDFEIERELRNAVAGTLASGTSEIQRMIIARHLGL